MELIDKPFENESEVAQIDQMTIENQLDKIQLYGSVEITKDKAGLLKVNQLLSFLQSISNSLKNQDLPENIKQDIQFNEGEIDNPFI